MAVFRDRAALPKRAISISSLLRDASYLIIKLALEFRQQPPARREDDSYNTLFSGVELALPSQSAGMPDLVGRPSENSSYISGLVRRLENLREGASIVNQLIAVGGAAVPVLSEALLDGRPRSVYQPRCRLVEALAGLHAHDVLLEYLRQPRIIADPEIRFAEDAVINTAARKLPLDFSASAFAVLLELAQTRSLPGVIEALGMYRRTESIPRLICSLESDLALSAAFDALRALGEAPKQLLVDEIFRIEPSPPDPESASSLHRRRACLRLLELLTLSPADRQQLLDLLVEKDPEVVLIVSKILASSENNFHRPEIRRRLIAVSSSLDWSLKDEAGELLAKLNERK